MEHATRISATEAARSFSDLLDRVRNRGERFLVERGGQPVAEIRAVRPPERLTLRQLLQRLGDSGLPGNGFGENLQRIRADQGVPRDPWRS